MSRSPSIDPVQGVSEMKFLLILGIVLIHCFDPGLHPDSNAMAGYEVTRYISSSLCRGCVPCFFILSGYLFFYGIRRFDPVIYGHKLLRRVQTLLVPYILWNLFCMGLLYVKHRWCGMSGLGIFLDDGGIDWIALLRGFWDIPQAGDYPYAFAFWFIRNLIVFVICAPLARFLSRGWVMFPLMVYVAGTGETLFGFVWFVAGAYIARKGIDFGTSYFSGKAAIIPAIVWLGAAWIYSRYTAPGELTLILLCLAQLLTLRGVGHVLIAGEKHSRILRAFVASTFIIFGLHQCFCSETRDLWIHLLGTATSEQILGGYLLSFLSMVLVSVTAAVLMRRFTPRLFALITGETL